MQQEAKAFDVPVDERAIAEGLLGDLKELERVL